MEDNCQYCSRSFNDAIRRKMVTYPCGHYGCFSCLREKLTPIANRTGINKKCGTCGNDIEKMEIPGGSSVTETVVKEEEEKEEEEEEKNETEKKRKKEKKSSDRPKKDRGLKRIKTKRKEEEEEEEPEVVILDDFEGEAENAVDALMRLKKAELPDVNPDWECPVCSCQYDNHLRIPMKVATCKKIEANTFQKRAARDDKPCGHTICEPCSLKVMDKACVICRANVTSYECNLKLLEEIVSHHSGEYVSLVRQVNECNDKIAPANEVIHELMIKKGRWEEREKELETAKSKLHMENGDLKLQVFSLTRCRQEAEELRTALAKKNGIEKELEAVRNINKLALLELIYSRLLNVQCGAIEPKDMGMTIRGDGLNGTIRENEAAKVMVEISTTPGVTFEKGKTEALIYGKIRAAITKDEDRMFRKIDGYNLNVEKTLSDDKKMIVTPPQNELDESYVENVKNDCVMVKTGTWLFRAIMELNNSNGPESTFDDGMFVERKIDPNALYKPVPTVQFVKAMKYYKDLAVEEQKRQKFLKEQSERFAVKSERIPGHTRQQKRQQLRGGGGEDEEDQEDKPRYSLAPPPPQVSSNAKKKKTHTDRVNEDRTKRSSQRDVETKYPYRLSQEAMEKITPQNLYYYLGGQEGPQRINIEVGNNKPRYLGNFHTFGPPSEEEEEEDFDGFDRFSGNNDNNYEEEDEYDNMKPWE